MLNRGHWNGLLLGSRLGCHPGLAALLVEGLAQGLAALGAGLAAGLTGGSNPCGKQFGSRTSHVKYNSNWQKHLPAPILHAFLAHTISVSDALSLSSSTPDHYQ